MENMEWDLGLLYKDEHDPQIETDVRAIEKTYIQFEKKYRNADFTVSTTKLLAAMQDFEKLAEKTTVKPWWYFALRNHLDAEDTVAAAGATKIEQRLNQAGNKIEFFSLVIGKIPTAQQKIFLAAPSLQPYAHFLKRIFDRAHHNLSEKEEQMLNLLSQTSYTMWVDGQEKVLNQKTVLHNGKEIPLSEALNRVRSLPVSERRALSDAINVVLKDNSQFAESEINAIYNYKKIVDELRGYKKPYSATVQGYENDEKTVEALIATGTKYFTLSKKFYTLHAKLLNEKKLTMADRGVAIGKINKKFDFDSAVDIVRDSFATFGPKYVEIFNTFLANKQIDVLPRKGKDAGAFCWGMGDLPTYVLLNHIGDINSVETLAHEMGHAIHTELSKKQPPLYQHYSTACAEVASTFFEQIVTDRLEKTLSPDEQIVLLHNRVMRDITTIFRQIAVFNFELELHQTIREKGEVSRDKIAVLHRKHMQAYVGPAVEVTENDGYFYVTWSHIRRFFYVYSYAYGQIISRALYEKWKADPSYEKKVSQFLSAGKSMSPKDIFKSIGITTNEAFFEAGFKGIEADIKKLERLAKKQKRI